MDDIKTAMSFQCEYLAVSFPKSATDMEMARQLANVAGEPWKHKPQLIAKIERSEAIPALEVILQGVATGSWWRAATSPSRSATRRCRRCRNA